MRSTFLIAGLASMAIGFAAAQTANSPSPNDPGKAALPRIDLTPLQNTDPANPAIRTTEGNNLGAPAVGSNSFTEDQAKSRIESRGFLRVGELTKDADGIWRGKAMKDGREVNVALDYQGNVVSN